MSSIFRIANLDWATGFAPRTNAAGCGKSAVADCLRRAAEAGLDRSEAIAALDESELEQRLYPPSTAPAIGKQRPQPDWTRIREELARRDHHVTLALLWTE